MAAIQFQSIRKLFGKFVALKDVSLTIEDGEFMVLLGPSGCGKTTLLRCLAGLERVDGGRVLIGDRDVTELAPRDRKIAMVFQSYAVFPHLTVFENIAFGLRMQRRPNEEVKKKVAQAGELLQLSPYLERYPAQLSGGQRQRVAVARAIVMEAAVLLMDEPLSNLDALLRLQFRAELKRLHQELRATTIYVTHDQVEALSLGDRIAVMKDGQIAQCDVPMQIYDYPANRFVGNFIGSPPMNFMVASVHANGGPPVVQVGDSRITPSGDTRQLVGRKNDQVLIGIRPENIVLSDGTRPGSLRGQVLVVEPLGSHKLLTLRVGQELLKVSAPIEQAVAPDDQVALWFPPEKIRWMDAATGEAL